MNLNPDNPAQRVNASGFLKLQRSSTTEELLYSDMKAMHLLTVIALRARYSNEPNLKNLRFGEATIGDHDAYGMTREEDRSARRRLAKWKLAAFSGSGRGTVATLLDSRVFSLSDERNSQKGNRQNNQQRNQQILEVKAENTTTPTTTNPTSEQPPHNHLTTTNKKDKKESMTQNDDQIDPSRPTAEQIYFAYPRKQGRKDALVAIAKAMEDCDPAALLERTQAYAAATEGWSDKDREFIPHPATWYNRGGYDDDPKTWVRKYGGHPNQGRGAEIDHSLGFFGDGRV